MCQTPRAALRRTMILGGGPCWRSQHATKTAPPPVNSAFWHEEAAGVLEVVAFREHCHTPRAALWRTMILGGGPCWRSQHATKTAPPPVKSVFWHEEAAGVLEVVAFREHCHTPCAALRRAMVLGG
jgi:uncharacterized protein YfaQ (DUF2300 family)